MFEQAPQAPWLFKIIWFSRVVWAPWRQGSQIQFNNSSSTLVEALTSRLARDGKGQAAEVKK
jgi:hypothetical protein